MQKSLLMQALLKFFAGVILLAGLLFIPCGSFHFWPAWLLMLVLFVPMLVAGIIMWLKSPVRNCSKNAWMPRKKNRNNALLSR